MKLTKSLDIAFLVLLQLASEKQKLSARKLSEGLKISMNHISKVIQILSRGGYIKTLRGKGGGIELAKPPEKIILKDIIQLVEGPICLMDCTIDKNACIRAVQCRLRLKIKEAQESMASVFQATSIADLLPERSR